MIYEYECSVCGRGFVEIKPISERDDVYCCHFRADRVVVNCFETDVDRAYKFVADFGGNPRQINSKNQYKRLLKEKGLIDASPKECLQIKKKKDSEYRRPELTKNIIKKLHQEGLCQYVRPWIKDNFTKNVRG